MSVFRTYAEIRALPDLSAAERELLEKAPKGEMTRLGDASPKEKTCENRIRAGIVRYLVLGGCTERKTHEKGVLIKGAYIDEIIDLDGCRTYRDLVVQSCYINEQINLIGARLGGLYLEGSHCRKGINAIRIKTQGAIHLSKGFVSYACIYLQGADIGGNFECDGGTFNASDTDHDIAICADGLDVKGDVFLSTYDPNENPGEEANRHSLDFRANGAVRLLGARIGGELSCIGGKFNAVPAKGSDPLSAEQQKDFPALKLDGAVIKGSMFWHEGSEALGRIDLTAATVGDLNDPDGKWPLQIKFNGFKYSYISRGPTDAKTRLEWLEKEDLSDGLFKPQPYEHLAKVLRDMGDPGEARTVLIRKEVLQRAEARRRLRAARSPRRFYAGARDWLLRYVVQYGHRPGFAFLWLLGFLLLGTAGFHLTWSNGGFAPASPVILTSAEWIDIERRVADNPAAFWADGPGKDYETFNALAYAFDVVVPVIDIGQESAWAPSGSRNWWGFGAWIGRWALEIAGWIVAALGAAAITGIIRRE